MTRHELRETVFLFLFQHDFYLPEEMKEELTLYLEREELKECTEKERQEIRIRSEHALSVCDELDLKINQVSEGWQTKRMGKVELTIIRLALYEMLYDGAVPTKVAINEAVELAKEYGGDESPSFVNGILAKLTPQKVGKEEG